MANPESRLPEPFAAIVEGLGSAEEPPTTREIDIAIDSALFAELGRLARRSRSRFLGGLVRLQIDIANLKVVVRARVLGTSTPEVSEMLTDGGSLSVPALLELLTLPPLEALERLGKMKALSSLPPGDLADLSRLDVAADNVVARYLRVARAVSIGPEPVIAYVLAREAEIVALRIVLIGRLSGIEPDALRVRLRESLF